MTDPSGTSIVAPKRPFFFNLVHWRQWRTWNPFRLKWWFGRLHPMSEIVWGTTLRCCALILQCTNIDHPKPTLNWLDFSQASASNSLADARFSGCHWNIFRMKQRSKLCGVPRRLPSSSPGDTEGVRWYLLSLNHRLCLHGVRWRIWKCIIVLSRSKNFTAYSLFWSIYFGGGPMIG